MKALAADGYKDAEPVLDRILNIVTASVSCGESVSIRNFGKFEPRIRSAVVRKNPRTGIEIFVPQKNSISFVPSPALKDKLNEV